MVAMYNRLVFKAKDLVEWSGYKENCVLSGTGIGVATFTKAINHTKSMIGIYGLCKDFEKEALYKKILVCLERSKSSRQKQLKCEKEIEKRCRELPIMEPLELFRKCDEIREQVTREFYF